jgi:Spy/CpxP family protein refolding chaperone
MKKYVLIAMAFIFAVSLSLTAQEAGSPKGPRIIQKREIRVEKHHGIVTPQMRADKMAKELGLTDAEKAKVKALIEKEYANRIKLQDEIEKSKQEFKTKFENAKKEHNEDLEKIIGKEKFQKLETLRTEKIKKMKHHRENMSDDSTFHGKKHMKEDLNK